MFSPTRDEARRFFFETWHKYRAQQPVNDMEGLVLDVMLKHPEYHTLLDNPDDFLDRDYSPDLGETNPFLHMSMHLAIEEQLSINQPAGLKDRFQQILEKCGDPHEAQHQVMECLAEMIWQAQRNGMAPDPGLYLNCLDNKRTSN